MLLGVRHTSQGLMLRRQIVGQYFFILLRNLQMIKMKDLIIYRLEILGGRNQSEE